MARTPGPWRVSSERWIVAKRGNNEGEIIASPTYWMENDKEEMAANAHLIAAAPDLLAACKAARVVLFAALCKLYAMTPSEPPRDAVDHETMVQLYDAIARAEGKS